MWVSIRKYTHSEKPSFLNFLHSSMAVIAIHILRDPGANCGAEGSLRNEQYIDPNLLSFLRILLGQEDLVTTPAVHASLFEHRKTFVYREIYFCWLRNIPAWFEISRIPLDNGYFLVHVKYRLPFATVLLATPSVQLATHHCCKKM